MFFIPLFEAKGVPAMTKIGFALLMTNLVAMIIPERPVLPGHILGLVTTGISELMVGTFMGLAIRIAFQTVSLAGEMIAHEGGFMRDASFDPFTQRSESAVERLLSQFAVVVFLTTSMHLQVFSSFVHSFEVVHLGVWTPTAASINILIAQTAQLFTVAVQIAAPFIALNFIINMTFAVLGKAAPQVNVFTVSFAVMIVIGLLTLVSMLDVIAHNITQIMQQSAENMLSMIQFR